MTTIIFENSKISKKNIQEKIKNESMVRSIK